MNELGALFCLPGLLIHWGREATIERVAFTSALTWGLFAAVIAHV